MNLKETKMIIDNKVQKVSELTNKRKTCTLNSYRFVHGSEFIFTERYQTNSTHEFTVESLTNEIDTLDNEILYLKSKLSEANEATKISFKGNTYSLSTAITMLKTFRTKLPSLKYMSEIKESRTMVSPNRFSEDTQTYIDISKPTFDVSLFRTKVAEMENDIITLQSLIDKANLETTITISL